MYPTVAAKGSSLCFSLVMNHPFVDGNKRVGHAAMETFLVLNGYELDADIEDAETVMLELASGLLGGRNTDITPAGRDAESCETFREIRGIVVVAGVPRGFAPDGAVETPRRTDLS